MPTRKHRDTQVGFAFPTLPPPKEERINANCREHHPKACICQACIHCRKMASIFAARGYAFEVPPERRE